MMTLGSLTPALIGHEWGWIEDHGGVFSFTPFFLYLAALSSGCWPLTMTMLLILAWRTLVFLRGEAAKELFWIFSLPFLLCLEFSGDWWPVSVLLVALGTAFFLWRQRRTGEV